MAVALAPSPTLAGRDLLAIGDLRSEELVELLDLAAHLKRLQHDRVPHRLLPDRTLAMIFQKASTRTRVSFEVGITQLGGTAVVLAAGDMQLGRGESVAGSIVLFDNPSAPRLPNGHRRLDSSATSVAIRDADCFPS